MVRSLIGVVKLKPQDIALGQTQYVSNCIRWLVAGRWGQESRSSNVLTS